MKSKTKIVLSALTILMLSSVLSAFTMMSGGDSYDVYLGDKLILQQYIHGRKAAPTLQMDERSNQQINIVYNQCGQTGTSRKITLKNGQNRMLKEWKFKDVNIHTKDGMVFSTKDVAAFKKDNKDLSLYYSATEREEVAIASIEWNEPTAKTN